MKKIIILAARDLVRGVNLKYKGAKVLDYIQK